MKAGY